ncbi:Bug family tripartite tricarboxylate transporter substrate binding protein [Bordetella genomosp. 9]|uniref:MFS transporter n=1 Tax=Bordetella genomosp. 9 TaxID=1416803 RepID=A0A1W6Z0A9_9BORD|nr:tripartite tricarboxylate transporter substrate binding protein [Bordetella genomosp. 9]ARP86681.1 MFS transporter [Bordetella genomosp. 9]
MRRFLSCAVAALGFTLAALAGSPATAAGAYPDKPVTLLIPYPPGGSADMLARPLSAILQARWGQPLVLEYKAGAGGTIATSQLARSKPDGYTLIMVLAAHAINPSLYAKLPYDTRKDFAPVSLVATLPMLVSAPLSTPANNMSEVVAYAKSHPGELTFASAGPGNTSHLAGEMFKSATGINMLHVPYKGSGPAVVALLGGEVSMMFDSFSTSYPQVQSGKLKALAVTGEKRSPLLPNVPTVAESAVPGFVVNGWYGVLAPAGTPAAIVDKLSADIAQALKDPALNRQLAAAGYEPVGSTPKEFAQYIDRELDRWGAAVKAAGVKIGD